MDQQHEIAMCELVGLELAGGLFYQESAAACAGQSVLSAKPQAVGALKLSATGQTALTGGMQAVGALKLNATGQTALTGGMQAVGALKLNAYCYGVYLPQIQTISYGDSKFQSLGAGTLQCDTTAYVVGAFAAAGSCAVIWNNTAYCSTGFAAKGNASLSMPWQAIGGTACIVNGASTGYLRINAYAHQKLVALCAGQASIAGALVRVAVATAYGTSGSSMALSSYGEMRHSIYGIGTGSLKGQRVANHDFLAAGGGASVIAASIVRNSAYRAFGGSHYSGSFGCYTNQRMTINGVSASKYVPTMALRYGHLAASYDVADRAAERRATVRPGEPRTTIKPPESRTTVVDWRTRITKWSGT